MRSLLLPFLVPVLSLEAIAISTAQPPAAPPVKVRFAGPDILQRGTRNLVYAEGTADGKSWKSLAPDQVSVRVSGAGRLVEDPAARPMNPFEVHCDDVDDGKVTVEIQSGTLSAGRTFVTGVAKPAGSFEATINPASVSHRFSGLGAGVLFYDNQFDITSGDDIYDWCFKDVRTTYLHVLIRPDYEKENDNADWRSLDLSKFDFRSLDRPFRIVKKALERNPDLRIYASLYTPPAWLKTNGATGGEGSLKEGLRSRQELAEYVYAYLKHAHAEGVPVHYLGFFNEPDFKHHQDGMFFTDLGDLAETFRDCARALDALVAADRELKKPPVYIFPDTLGAGSITRSVKGTPRLRERARLLDRVGVWGVHDYWNQAGTYWNDRYRELRAFPGVRGKPVWMTEWAQRERHGDLASGVEYGAVMLNALRLGAEAWMAFEWCHPSGNQAGLISTDWGARPPRARYWRSKAYHVFRQIANTTPPGAQVVSMTGRWKGTSQAGGKGIEYLALRDGGDVIVHLMNTEPAPVTYRLTVRGPAGEAEGWLTSALADMAAAGAAEMMAKRQGDAAAVSGVIPANSLLSLVLRGTPRMKPS
jgi:hypothetical protein